MHTQSTENLNSADKAVVCATGNTATTTPMQDDKPGLVTENKRTEWLPDQHILTRLKELWVRHSDEAHNQNIKYRWLYCWRNWSRQFKIHVLLGDSALQHQFRSSLRCCCAVAVLKQVQSSTISTGKKKAANFSHSWPIIESCNCFSDFFFNSFQNKFLGRFQCLKRELFLFSHSICIIALFGSKSWAFYEK